MEHREIEADDITDRYLLGQLPAEERARFEQHFVDCSECLDRLEATADFRDGLKTVAAEEATRARAYVRTGLRAWVARTGGRRVVVSLGAIVLLAALPTWLLIREVNRARRAREQVELASADWERQYRQQQETARRLAQELHAAEQKLAEQRREIETQLARERQARAAREPNVPGGAQVATPIFALSAVRGGLGQSPTPNQLRLPRPDRRIVLSLEFEPDPELRSYRATITDAGGRAIWSAGNLRLNAVGVPGLSLDSRLLRPGEYLLTLEGLPLQGRPVPVARYPLRVIKP